MAPPVNFEGTRQWMLVYHVGLYCILWYDYLLTLPQEYRRVWKMDWNAVKIAYLANRYFMLATSVAIVYGFAMDWSTEKCQKHMLPLQLALPYVVAAASGVLILVRCYIIWQKSRVILAVLSFALAIQLGVDAWCLKVGVAALPFVKGCIPASIDNPGIIYCSMAWFFDMLAGGLCLWKAFEIEQSMKDVVRSTVVDRLVTSGGVYVIGTVLCNAANFGLGWSSGHDAKTPLRLASPGFLCTVFTSILAARLVLDTKASGEAATSEVVSIPITPIGTSFRAQKSGLYTSDSLRSPGPCDLPEKNMWQEMNEHKREGDSEDGHSRHSGVYAV